MRPVPSHLQRNAHEGQQSQPLRGGWAGEGEQGWEAAGAHADGNPARPSTRVKRPGALRMVGSIEVLTGCYFDSCAGLCLVTGAHGEL